MTLFRSVCFCLAVLWMPMTAQAQGGASPGSNAFDDEITVTGQQQERVLQDTAESVDVTSGEELEDLSTVDLYELVERTPNVNAAFGFKGFSIRGIDQRASAVAAVSW